MAERSSEYLIDLPQTFSCSMKEQEALDRMAISRHVSGIKFEIIEDGISEGRIIGQTTVNSLSGLNQFNQLLKILNNSNNPENP
jgi:hypothetical protein